MKIVFLVHQFFPEYYTGTEKFVYKMSSMVQKVGHSVRVLTYSLYQDSFFDKTMGGILYKDFTYKGVPVTAMRHRKIPENVGVVLGDRSMRAIAEHLLSREKPDVVHVGHPMRVNEFIWASQSLDIPYVLTLTDFWLICPKVNLVNSKGDLCAGPDEGKTCKYTCPEFHADFIADRSRSARDILFGAKKVVSPSRFLGGVLKNAMGALDIMVINHGISYSQIKRNDRKAETGDPLIFCYAGSLNDHKGVHTLIDAFKMIKADHVVLKIFGSGPNPLYVNRLLDMAKRDKRIEFCGVYPEDDVGNILSNVDVAIIPSLVYENYPLVLHEALACNTPVIASNIGGMAEKIQDGINGFSFRVGDAESLKAIMERIISGPEILNDLKINIKSSMVPAVEQEAYAYHRIYCEIGQREDPGRSNTMIEKS
ncbi:MAG TPA: glycosyltransferase [Nitrospiraceae bacterium]|jgi:glycosyltransferase involved in cell wall biosynthesis|nr:glycosyltransferase [Nitrospiraceae bacterium]